MNRQHFQGLDGLRGLAILLVVFYHYFPHRGTGLVGYLASGSWLGVDLFFVLSGFLITGILYDTKDTPHLYRNFYMRRALRLFPLYFLFIGVVLLIARGPGGHSWMLTLTYLFYGSNIVRYFLPGFQAVGPVDTGHLWSLAVEEQFYLIWPWMVVALGSRTRILKVCAYGSVAALVLRLVLARISHAELVFLYLELPTRADALLAGAALAMLYREPGMMARLKPSVIRATGVAAGVGLLALSVSAHSISFMSPPVNTWGFSLSSVGSACVLLLAIQPGTWMQRIFSGRMLRFFGKYSYGLYLIHMAPMAYYKGHLGQTLLAGIHPLWLAGTVSVLLTLGVSTGLAVLSYHLIEQPFLRMKYRFEDARPRSRDLAATIPVGREGLGSVDLSAVGAVTMAPEDVAREPVESRP